MGGVALCPVASCHRDEDLHVALVESIGEQPVGLRGFRGRIIKSTRRKDFRNRNPENRCDDGEHRRCNQHPFGSRDCQSSNALQHVAVPFGRTRPTYQYIAMRGRTCETARAAAAVLVLMSTFLRKHAAGPVRRTRSEELPADAEAQALSSGSRASSSSATPGRCLAEEQPVRLRPPAQRPTTACWWSPGTRRTTAKTTSTAKQGWARLTRRCSLSTRTPSNEPTGGRVTRVVMIRSGLPEAIQRWSSSARDSQDIST